MIKCWPYENDRPKVIHMFRFPNKTKQDQTDIHSAVINELTFQTFLTNFLQFAAIWWGWVQDVNRPSCSGDILCRCWFSGTWTAAHSKDVKKIAITLKTSICCRFHSTSFPGENSLRNIWLCQLHPTVWRLWWDGTRLCEVTAAPISLPGSKTNCS